MGWRCCPATIFKKGPRTRFQRDRPHAWHLWLHVLIIKGASRPGSGRSNPFSIKQSFLGSYPTARTLVTCSLGGICFEEPVEHSSVDDQPLCHSAQLFLNVGTHIQADMQGAACYFESFLPHHLKDGIVPWGRHIMSTIQGPSLPNLRI
jgi:hypothetical protein